MIKRTLKLIRDDYNQCKMKSGSNEESHEVEETLQKITATNSLSEFDVDVKLDIKEFKGQICIAIKELQGELEASGGNIAQQALEHIYSDEVVMTIGRSKTVEAFLKFASKHKRKFQVIVAECAPFYNVRSVLLYFFILI